MHGQLAHFNNLGRIGEGTYGVVLKCQHKITGQLVAVKKFKDTEDDEQVRKTALREVKILQNLRHDNVVRLLDFFRVHRKLFLVFEFVEGTVLQELEKAPHGLGDFASRKIMWQLVRATQHLHASKIVHRDIKPENMLLSSTGLLKLCDFGFARYLSAPAMPSDMSDYVATRWYRAPELLVGDRSYGAPVDVWAIGCMVVEMQTGQPLFPGNSDTDQLWLIVRSFTKDQMEEMRDSPIFQHIRCPAEHERETLDQRFPNLQPEILEFLKACLQPNAARRATCWELLQMQYFAQAASWFPRNFFPSLAEREVVRQAMSVERQRVTQRRPKRKADARTSFMAQALNISPCRDRSMPEPGHLRWMAQASNLRPAEPSAPLQCCVDGQSPFSPSRMVAPATEAMDIVETTCSVTLPKGGRQKGNVVFLEARAGLPAQLASSNVALTGAAPEAGRSASNDAESSRTEGGQDMEGLQMGRRRSQKTQAPQNEWQSPTHWQGAEQRTGAQFITPDPRGVRHRERRQPIIDGKQAALSPMSFLGLDKNHIPTSSLFCGSSKCYTQTGRNISHQSPMKGHWKGEESWRNGGSKGRGRGRGAPSLSRASVDLAMPACDEPNHQTIRAHYSLPQSLESSEHFVHPWVQRGWVAPSQPNQSQARLDSPQMPAYRWQGNSETSSRARLEPGTTHHGSPLRAHAPPFVPQALQFLQGRKAENHNSETH